MARILVVDDEEGVRTFVAECLQGDGHSVVQAGSGEAALAIARESSFELVVTDLRMPGIDGLELLVRLRAEQPELEFIVLTAHGSVDTAVEAMKKGAFDFVQKPVGSPAELRLVAERALERRALKAFVEHNQRDRSAPPLGYGDPAMDRVMSALTKVAGTDATVVLVGESGTGKEVAARTVHALSPRAAGPFVVVNCATLSENLLSSELFGHEKGAFTGATARKRGRLELAHGGTFFLDEIGELKLDLQAKLLRVVQERVFERVGGTRAIEVDVRWIAATNRDLRAMVADGSFREDLYHRIAVFPVLLPALRDRPKDIAPLARRLLAQACAQLKRPELTLAETAIAQLERAPWTGNVRELANALERAAILADGDTLQPEDLWLEPTAAARPEAGETAASTLAELEERAIVAALAALDGNRRKAAERLGIGLRTLYDKMKRYGIE